MTPPADWMIEATKITDDILKTVFLLRGKTRVRNISTIQTLIGSVYHVYEEDPE